MVPDGPAGGSEWRGDARLGVFVAGKVLLRAGAGAGFALVNDRQLVLGIVQPVEDGQLPVAVLAAEVGGGDLGVAAGVGEDGFLACLDNSLFLGLGCCICNELRTTILHSEPRHDAPPVSSKPPGSRLMPAQENPRP